VLLLGAALGVALACGSEPAPEASTARVEGEAKLEVIPLPHLRLAGEGTGANPHRHGDSAP
jgi:hypothetical protein